VDSTQVQPLRLGTRLEGFEVSRVTDHDPGGYTYVGHEVSSKKPVVIREYPPQVAQDLAALAKARHANLAVVLRTFEASNRAYLITEPIAGEALSDLLLRENSAYDEARLKSILLPLADGLEAAHVGGVLHLDIQPDHIVIRPNGAPVLVGFGAGNSPTQNPGYSAIEQYSKEFRTGRWTDIYALGAVAYRLISGQVPPPGDQRYAKDEMRPAAEIGANKYSRSLLRAIDWALKVHPLERPQNLAQWKDALLGLSETIGVGAGAGAGATVPITATMIRKFSELRQKKKEPAAPAPRKTTKTLIPPTQPGIVERELEKQRLEQEKAERERAERERAERAEQERSRAEQQRLERERIDREKAERERAEHERSQRERAERERADHERQERERAERERREQAERERQDRQRAERERTEREQAERARLEREKADRERVERERAERDRQERERAERERRESEALEKARAEKARVERELAERERLEREKREQERAERERAANEREERERAELRKMQRERAERERIEREKQEREWAAEERAKRDRARSEPAVGVPIVNVPPRIPQRSRPAQEPPSGGPSWLSAVGAVLVLVLAIGFWWYNDARHGHSQRVAESPIERVAPANPPAPLSAQEAKKPKPEAPKELPAHIAPPAERATEERKVEPPPPAKPEVSASAPEPAPTTTAPETSAAREPTEPETKPETKAAPEPKAPTEPKAEAKAPARSAKSLEAPAGASEQKQLVSQLRRKLAGNWTQESTYSVVVPGDGCYAKIARSWDIRFGGTGDDGRALTATYQTKVRAQSAERRECRQFDDQITVEGALTARPVSGNTLQVESVPTRCAGDCDQIAEVFNYRKLERRYRFNVSADGYLSFSEDEVDFELKGPRR